MNRKKNIILFFLMLFAAAFIFDSCKPKAACGSKRDHKVRKRKTKKMAPGMMLGYNSQIILPGEFNQKA